MDYLEADLQKEFSDCPNCSTYFAPEQGRKPDRFILEDGKEVS